LSHQAERRLGRGLHLLLARRPVLVPRDGHRRPHEGDPRLARRQPPHDRARDRGVQGRRPHGGDAPAWFHSDQGSEYVSGAYESLLALYGTKASQSRKSSPRQNGFQQSFYSQFKLELGDVRRFAHVGELIEAVAGQIACYNTRRIHSAIKMPPATYRDAQKQKMAAFAALQHAYSLPG
jgi:transposase InsO family protein